jgi:hypothetical protein
VDLLQSQLADKVTKTNAEVDIPTFDSLGIYVPPTVFFMEGLPVLWYYTCKLQLCVNYLYLAAHVSVIHMKL